MMRLVTRCARPADNEMFRAWNKKFPANSFQKGLDQIYTAL